MKGAARLHPDSHDGFLPLPLHEAPPGPFSEPGIAFFEVLGSWRSSFEASVKRFESTKYGFFRN